MSIRSRLRRPSPPLRWASRIEAWPPVLWLGLQCVALAPVAPGVALLLASAIAAAQWRGQLGCDWPARAHWLAIAATLTGAAHLLADPVSGGITAALAATAMAAAWLAFRRAERGLRRTTRRLVEQALMRVQHGAACKGAYALALVAIGAGAAR